MSHKTFIVRYMYVCKYCMYVIYLSIYLPIDRYIYLCKHAYTYFHNLICTACLNTVYPALSLLPKREAVRKVELLFLIIRR